jgi:perosamine synthetase
MKIQRTIPPAAAPMELTDFWYGLRGFLSGDKAIRRLEEEIKEYFGVEHVFLVSSGKAALTLILLALKSLSTRTEVVIPAYTCFSVPSAVVRAGLKLTLCDIDAKTFGFDRRQLKETLNGETLCVVPDHLFGIPEAMHDITGLATERGIYVVEDAAQAMQGSYNGQRLGTIGDVGFFSLGRGKNITCGSGGIIVTNSDPIAEAISSRYTKLHMPGSVETAREFLRVLLMSIFIRPWLYWFPAGLRFLRLGETVFHAEFPVKKFSGMKAGLLWDWKRRLEHSRRARIMSGISYGARLTGEQASEAEVPYLRFPVLAGNREMRDRVYSLSQSRGLGISLMYPASINRIPEISPGFNGQHFPAAEKVAETLLTLPTHHFVSEQDQQAISELLQEMG